MADRTAHSRRSVRMLWRIHLAMLIYRDRGVKVKIIDEINARYFSRARIRTGDRAAGSPRL